MRHGPQLPRCSRGRRARHAPSTRSRTRSTAASLVMSSRSRVGACHRPSRSRASSRQIPPARDASHSGILPPTLISPRSGRCRCRARVHEASRVLELQGSMFDSLCAHCKRGTLRCHGGIYRHRRATRAWTLRRVVPCRRDRRGASWYTVRVGGYLRADPRTNSPEHDRASRCLRLSGGVARSPRRPVGAAVFAHRRVATDARCSFVSVR